jgi:hypothetical protein
VAVKSVSGFRVDHTWLERAEITHPWIGLQSLSKSRLQLSGGLSFASAIASHQPCTVFRVAATTASLTDKMPTLSKRLAHADCIRPNSRVTDIESFRRFQEVMDELSGLFSEQVLGQVADGAMPETAPCGCLACEGEEGEGG